jgi:hypothetical protein
MAVMPMIVQQALFSSVQAGENEGYQIAGHSAEVDANTRRELTAWGPSHDSLQPGASETGSINGHTLADGRYCLSLTRITSDEYSGRGANVATWLLIATADAFSLCGHHPLRLLESALAAGWTRVDAAQEISLIGRSEPVHLEGVAEACSVFPAETLAALVDNATGSKPLGVLLDHDQRLLIDSLFSLLPIGERASVSFTTGLLPSAKRPFQLHVLAPQTDVKNLFARLMGGQLCDPTDLKTHAVTDHGRKLAELLVLQRWSDARRLVLGQ